MRSTWSNGYARGQELGEKKSCKTFTCCWCNLQPLLCHQALIYSNSSCLTYYIYPRPTAACSKGLSCDTRARVVDLYAAISDNRRCQASFVLLECTNAWLLRIKNITAARGAFRKVPVKFILSTNLIMLYSSEQEGKYNRSDDLYLHEAILKEHVWRSKG